MCELFQFRPAYLQFPSDWWEDSPGTTLWTVAALGIAFLQSSRALRSCSSAALIKSLRVSMFRRPFEAVDRILGLHIKEDKHRPPVSTCLRLSLSLSMRPLWLCLGLCLALSLPRASMSIGSGPANASASGSSYILGLDGETTPPKNKERWRGA